MNMGKAVAIDAASTTTSYWTGYACNEMGLPLPLTLMLSMGAGQINSVFSWGKLRDYGIMTPGVDVTIH